MMKVGQQQWRQLGRQYRRRGRHQKGPMDGHDMSAKPNIWVSVHF